MKFEVDVAPVTAVADKIVGEISKARNEIAAARLETLKIVMSSIEKIGIALMQRVDAAAKQNHERCMAELQQQPKTDPLSSDPEVAQLEKEIKIAKLKAKLEQIKKGKGIED